MKYLVSFSLLFFAFVASANSDNVAADDRKNVTIESSIGGDRGKKARKGKRTNKKRKRKCAQFSRRGFAG